MKHTLKQILIFLLSIEPVLWAYLLFRRKSPRIILYHGVSDIDCEKDSCQVIGREQFTRQIKYLKKHYKNVPLSKVISAAGPNELLPKNGITITFDDGYENNFRCATPILLEYGFTASIFLVPKYVEMAQQRKPVVFWWDIIDYVMNSSNYGDFIATYKNYGIIPPSFTSLSALKVFLEEELKNSPVEIAEKIVQDLLKTFKLEIEANKFPKIMNWDQVRSIMGKGLEIGAHTMSHVTASKLSRDRYEEEFVLSKKMIEERIGARVDAFALPYGGKQHYSKDVIKAIKKAEYKCALLVLSGNDEEEKDPFCLDRTAISKDDDFKTFKIKVAGIFDDLTKIRRRIGKLWKSAN